MRLLSAIALLLAALPARGASQVTYRAINPQLEEARKLVAKGEFEPALEKLRVAQGLPGNTSRQLAEAAALEATALLALPPTAEHRQQADEALAHLFHADAEGAALQLASPAAQERAKAVLASRPLLLHERIVTARTGQPILLRARLSGAQPSSAQVYASYRLEPQAEGESGHDEEYVHVLLDPQRGGAFEAYLRPGIGGIPVRGEHVLRYYVEARSPEGTQLDQNGSALQPIRAQLSETLAESVASGAHVAALDEGGKGHPLEVAPETPWYKKWQIVVPAAAVVVVAAVVTVVLVQGKPQPQSGSLGRVDLP